MLKGLSTVTLEADDLAAARAWYTELLGVEPYMDRGPYIEFRVGDYQHELGLIDRAAVGQLGAEPAQADGPSGAVVYWQVDDVQDAIDRLTAMGARLHHPVRDFGTGFVIASVVDPFGNIVGLMHSPHYLAVLADRGGRREQGSAA
jgi:predicted enzyme related to lactoylglutathione lyase